MLKSEFIAYIENFSNVKSVDQARVPCLILKVNFTLNVRIFDVVIQN